ncbi:hypothetical protein CYY_000810 [Polysphondylium violaceum]|uniref:Lipase n=1 Tax=Polysphondylium violaceum TaxID=133409 RepID=A0A8J4V574_9MYCE|nr:hypothetical protein CYY_000810 [Polysphondylium violaceum]
MKSPVLVLLLLIQLINANQDKNELDILLESKLNLEELIQSHGYQTEKHYLTTGDGYILTIFRIPWGINGKGSKDRKPVILQHGLLDSSFGWVVNLPHQSLAYILADQGYDVWLMNFRGTTYSLNHTRFDSKKDKEYWQFSFDEMAEYDTPYLIDYVLEYTGASHVGLVGHSQGTLVSFLSFLKFPELAYKVSLFVGLGPVGNLTHMQNPILKGLASLHFDGLLSFLGINQFLPSPKLFRNQFINVCNICNGCCSTVIEMLVGASHRQNSTRVPLIAANDPSGTSMMNMNHFTQMYRSGVLRMYDYGAKENKRHYGTSLPPLYDYALLPNNLNIVLYSADKDILTTPTDVDQLVQKLPHPTLKYWQIVENYSHVDFIWAIDAHQLIYPTIIEQLNEYLV